MYSMTTCKAKILLCRFAFAREDRMVRVSTGVLARPLSLSLSLSLNRELHIYLHREKIFEQRKSRTV